MIVKQLLKEINIALNNKTLHENDRILIKTNHNSFKLKSINPISFFNKNVNNYENCYLCFDKNSEKYKIDYRLFIKKILNNK